MFYLRNNLSLRNLILFQIDSLLILASSYLVFALKFGGHIPSSWLPFLEEAIFIAILCQLMFFLNELYDVNGRLSLSNMIIRIIIAFAISSLALALFYLLFPSSEVGKGLFLYIILISLVLITFWRAVFGWALAKINPTQRIIIYGSGSTARMIAQAVVEEGNPKYHIEGFADEHGRSHAKKIMGLKVFNTERDLLEVIAEKKINRIVVALNQRRGVFPVNTLLDCKLRGVQVVDLPDFYEQLTGKILIRDLRPSWLIFSPGFRHTSVYKAVKRFSDVVFSIVGLILASPIMLVTAILIKLDSPGPVLFKQERVGQYGKSFILMKFRSMQCGAEEDTGPVWAQENDCRITRVGRIIRKLRIDELPQMINVLKGEMSFVGPRPERPYFIQKLQQRVPYYIQRLTVKPGITGWAAVKFQYSSSIEGAVEKLQYDLYYIKNISLFLDLFVILKTIQVIVTGKGSR
jgi:sugar transferase (PEP-CTERM system associated)